jgi:hypothetical protein
MHVYNITSTARGYPQGAPLQIDYVGVPLVGTNRSTYSRRRANFTRVLVSNSAFLEPTHCQLVPFLIFLLSE